jgi:hypothetical protein
MVVGEDGVDSVALLSVADQEEISGFVVAFARTKRLTHSARKFHAL